MTTPDAHPVDWEEVRRLSGRRGSPAISSVYLDVDGAHRPVPASYEQAFNQLASELRRLARARQDPHLARSVEGDIEAMRAWLAVGIDRSDTRGLALFSCAEEGYFEVLEVPVPVRDEAAIGPRPRVRPLVEMLDESGAFLLALVDRTHLRLFDVEEHRIEEHAPLVTPQSRSVDTSVELGSWEHHREEEARAHLRRAAEALEEAVRRRPVGRILLGGPEEALAGLERLLHPGTRALVAGRVQVRVAAPTTEIATVARAAARKVEHRHEVRVVEQMRQRAAGGRGAVVGLEPTLAALAERRVGTLLVRDGFSAPGGHCPACGHVGPDIRQCPVCGTTNVEVDDVVEIAIEEAVAQRAVVEFCRDTELDRFGGIAALERFA